MSIEHFKSSFETFINISFNVPGSEFSWIGCGELEVDRLSIREFFMLARNHYTEIQSEGARLDANDKKVIWISDEIEALDKIFENEGDVNFTSMLVRIEKLLANIQGLVDNVRERISYRPTRQISTDELTQRAKMPAPLVIFAGKEKLEVAKLKVNLDAWDLVRLNHEERVEAAIWEKVYDSTNALATCLGIEINRGLQKSS